MVTDFQREILEPMKKNLSTLNRLNNQKNSIVQKYWDQDAQAILQSRWARSAFQQQIVNKNPNIQRDLSQLSALDEMTTRLQNQKKMLENDYLHIYGNAMANANRTQWMIQRQTEDMMQGSAMAQLRDQWFAMWQATKRWDSEAMKWKIQSDFNRQWAEQRLQIQAQQMDRSIQADTQRQNTLLWIAGQLQQQQQQDFQNRLVLQQMSQPRPVVVVKNKPEKNASYELLNKILMQIENKKKQQQQPNLEWPLTQKEKIRRILEQQWFKSVLPQ